MMDKNFVFSLCLLHAFSVTAFMQGKRYVYDYLSYSDTGITEGIKQFARIGIKGELVVQTENDFISFQLRDLKRGQANYKIENDEDDVPNFQFSEESVPLLDELQKPFWVKFYAGKVNFMLFSLDDKTPNYNIKKAIATTFQVYITDQKQNSSKVALYKTLEDGITGMCNVTYSISHMAESNDLENIIHVTKIRHDDECTNHPYLFQSSIQGYKCPQCNENKKQAPITHYNEISYEIKQSSSEFAIRKIKSVSSITVNFFSNGRKPQSRVTQTYDLKQVEDAGPDKVPENFAKIKWLLYTFESDHRDLDDINLKEAHHYNRLFKIPREKMIDSAEKLIKSMSKIEQTELPLSDLYVSLVDAFTAFNYTDFEYFYNNYLKVDKEATFTQRDIFHEVLPVIGTNPAILFTMNLIRNQKIKTRIANEMIHKLPFYVKEPSLKLLEFFRIFIQTGTITKHYNLFTSSRLAYGTLLNRACSETFSHYSGTSIIWVPADICSYFIEELIVKCNRSVEKFEQSIYLRTIINTRRLEAFSFLAEFATSNKSFLLRNAALRSLIYYKAEKATEIAVATARIFFNPKEDYVMRIHAFQILLQTRPILDFFPSLISRIKNEENEKVKTFMYSTLLMIANATDPCYLPFKQQARSVLLYLEKYDLDMIKHSFHVLFSGYDEKYNYGRSTEIISIPNKKSAIPRSIYFKQSVNLLGYNFDIFEFGFESEGVSLLHYLLQNRFQPNGLADIKLEHFSAEVENLIKKFKFPSSKKGKLGAFEIFVKWYNQDVSVAKRFDRGEELSEGNEITHDTHGKSTLAKLNLLSTTFVEVEFIVPNELGLPVILRSRLPIIFHLGGDIKATFNPVGKDKTDTNRQLHDTLLDIDLHCLADFSLSSSIFVDGFTLLQPNGFALTSTGVLKVPLKVTVIHSALNSSITVKYTPPSNSTPFFDYQTIPKTFGKTEQAVHFESKQMQKTYDIGTDYFGVGLQVSLKGDHLRNNPSNYLTFVDSFFQQETSVQEHYLHLVDKFYVGIRHFIDISLLNPTNSPYLLSCSCQQSSINATEQFIITMDSSNKKHFVNGKEIDNDIFTLDIIGIGEEERYWSSEIVVSKHIPDLSIQGFYFKLWRSPIPNYDSEQYEICYVSNFTYNDYQEIFNLIHTQIGMQYDGNLTFGTSCDSNISSYIKFMFSSEATEEQLSLRKYGSPIYKKCLEVLKNRYSDFHDVCWKAVKDLGRMDQFNLNVFYDIEHMKIYNVFVYLQSWIRHHLQNYLEINHFEGSDDLNSLKIVANLSYFFPIMDVKIVYPATTVSYENIHIPHIFPRFEPFTIAENFRDQISNLFFSFKTPKCLITSHYLHTFDDVIYNADVDECYRLAISDTHNHHVYVLYRLFDSSNDTLDVKIIFDNDVIHMFIENETLIMFFDEMQMLSDKTEMFTHRIVHERELTINARRFGNGFIVDSDDYGLNLYFDGKILHIVVSNFYKGKQQGLCGNFDGEQRGEFEGFDGTVHTNVSDFVSSFTIEETCSNVTD